MKNLTKQQASLSKICTMEFFGTNGSKNITGDKSIIFTKIECTEGKNNWILLYQN